MFEKGTIPGVTIAHMKGLQYALPASTKRERRDKNFKIVLNNSKTTVATIFTLGNLNSTIFSSFHQT